MPKGPKGEKRPADVIGNAVHVIRHAHPSGERLGAARHSAGLRFPLPPPCIPLPRLARDNCLRSRADCNGRWRKDRKIGVAARESLEAMRWRKRQRQTNLPTGPPQWRRSISKSRIRTHCLWGSACAGTPQDEVIGRICYYATSVAVGCSAGAHGSIASGSSPVMMLLI
jgi:hypothetical protein